MGNSGNRNFVDSGEQLHGILMRNLKYLYKIKQRLQSRQVIKMYNKKY